MIQDCLGVCFLLPVLFIVELSLAAKCLVKVEEQSGGWMGIAGIAGWVLQFVIGGASVGTRSRLVVLD